MRLSAPAAVTALFSVAGAGFAAGWLLKEGPQAAPVRASSSSRPFADAPSGSSPAAAAAAGGAAKPVIGGSLQPESVAAEAARIKALPLEEFAVQMADVWIDRGNPESHLKKALFLASCDSTRAMAFYNEYHARRTLPWGDDIVHLREFLTIMGKRDGAGFMGKLMADVPEGAPQLDSLLHGWVEAKPDEAVAWLNAVPEDAPYYGRSLRGLVWGLGESSPAAAVEVYKGVEPGERDGSLCWSLGTAVINRHGLEGLNSIVEKLETEPERRQLLTASMPSALQQRPADFVGGMARHLESVPELGGPYEAMADRWAAGEPEAALAWVNEKAVQGESAAALTLMARRLTEAGKGEALDAWLAANPGAPRHAAVAAGRAVTLKE